MSQGVSTVASNHSLPRVTLNAAAILTAAGLAATVPLVPGAARPLFGPAIACPAIHGDSGLCTQDGAFADAVASTGAPGPAVLPGPAPIAMAAASEAAHAALNAGNGGVPRRVALVATGALTNVALLLWLYPSIASLISLTVMGGAVGAGNTHPCAEFNIAVDPHAGAAVFGAAGLVNEKEDGNGHGAPRVLGRSHSGHGAGPTAVAGEVDDGDGPPPLPVALVPLEVTHTAIVDSAALNMCGLDDGGGGGGGGGAPLSPFKSAIRDLLLFFHASYASTFDGFAAGPPLHDPCAVLLALEPDAFTVARGVRVDVEAASPLCAGQTVIDLNRVTGRPPNADVATGMDGERLWRVLGEALREADAVSPLNERRM